MSITVKLEQATFEDDVSTANLTSVALSYKDSASGKRGRAFFQRDGSHRLKGPEIAPFLVKLAEHRVTFREIAKDEYTWPTVRKTLKNYDKDGYVTTITEYY